MNLTGHNIGRYHILEKLGEGGMAVVYKAYDTHLEHEVAVKVIRIDNLPRNAEERALKRFEREAKAVAKLDHPNIVKVTDYGDHEGSPYLVMPYLPGGTLKQFLKEHGHLDWREATRMLMPVAEALAYAHEQGLIHRDVKPSNILLSAKGWPMLTDFGVAKVVDDEMTQDLTGTSATVGTPEYMAPEQVMSKTVDHRADIYALGVVFYEMVTGRRPYEADTPMAVLVMHSRDPLPRPKELVPDLPDEVERVLLKALAKRPEDRHFDMAAFAGALAGLQRGEPGKPSVKVGATPRPVTVKSDQYKTVEQFTEATGSERIRTDRDIPAKISMQAQPEAPAQRAGTKTPFIIGGVALTALLVIGIINGWFKPRPAAPAPTALPVIAETDLPTFTTLTPTATTSPPTVTSMPPTPTEAYTIGSTMVSPKDGMTMVYVPAGEFLMGQDFENRWGNNESPQHEVFLDAYWIDRTEVTNVMYARCVLEGVCSEPETTKSYFRSVYYGNPTFEKHPVIYVNWFQAKQYCEWVGRDLPTEAQWEKAARGTDGRIYPWGNFFDCSLTNGLDHDDVLYYGKADEVPLNCDGFVDTAPVGYLQDASPYGAMDMMGNVYEWVADWYQEDYYRVSPPMNPKGPSSGESRVSKGGSWLSGLLWDPIYGRGWSDPTDSSDSHGFRCASETP